MIYIAIKEIDCRKVDIEEEVVASIEAVNDGVCDRFEVVRENVSIFDQLYNFFFSVNWKNMGVSFSVVKGEEVVMRYGGIIATNSHFDFSVGPGQLVEVLIEVR